MRFQLFYEKFAGGVKSFDSYSDVYVNPNWADRNEMAGNDKFPSFRAILSKNGDLYAWIDKGATHAEVAHNFNLSFRDGAIAFYIHPEDRTNVILSIQNKEDAENFPQNKDKILNNQHLQSFLDEPIRM